MNEPPQTTVAEALTTLMRMRDAAPPVAATRLNSVIATLRDLKQQNEFLTGSLASLYDSAPDPARAGGTGRLRMNTAGNPDLPTERPRVSTAQLAELGRRPSEPSPPFASDPMSELLLRVQEQLQSPLAGVSASARTLEQGELGRILPEQREVIANLRQQAEFALQLLDSVMDIVRLEQGTFDLRLSTFHAEDLVRAAVAQLTAKISQHDHRIQTQIDEVLPPVHADFASALVILGDLLDNALHYTPYGGAIRVSAVTIGTHVLMTVEDNGIGLTPDDIAQIGQPFWRALHQPLVRARMGTGLRLYLARQILVLMGGEMFYSSDVGMGSSFSVLLPLAESAPP